MSGATNNNSIRWRNNVSDCLSSISTYISIILGILLLSIPSTMIVYCLPCLLDLDNDSESSSSSLSQLEVTLTRVIGGLFLTFGLTYTIMRSSKSTATTNSRYSNDEDDTNEQHCGEQDDDRIEDMERIVNVRRVLTSQSCLGLCLLLIGFIQTSTDDNDDDGSSTRTALQEQQQEEHLCGRTMIPALSLIIAGTVCFILACVGLMISYWTPAADDVDDDVVLLDNDSNATNSNNNNSSCCLMSMMCCYRSDQNSSRFDILEEDELATTPSTVPLLSNEYETSPTNNNTNDNFNGNDDLEATTTNTAISTTPPSQPPTSPNSRITGTRRLLKLAGPHSSYLFLGCLVLLIRLPFSLSIPHFVSTTLGALAQLNNNTDHNNTNTITSEVHQNILFLFLAGTIDASLDFFCIYLFDTANINIVRGVRLDTFTAILRQDMAFFDTTKSGDLASRLNSDCGEMGGDLTWFFRFSIESVVRITGIVCYMLIRSPRLGLCAVSVVPVVAAVNKWYGDWLHRNAVEVQNALAGANSVAQEAFSCVRTVIAFAAEKFEGRRYQERIDTHYHLNVRQIYARGVYYMMISTFLINTCVQALLLYVGSVLVLDGTLQVQVLLAFMLYQGQLQSEVLNLFNSFTSLIKSSGAGEKVFALLDRETPAPGTGSILVRATEYEDDVDTNDDDGFEVDNDLPRKSLDATLSNITFAYPSRPSDYVLQNLDLHIPAGRTVAIVGKSGCGKSTIVNLLQRLYDPSSGCIKIDGFDLSELDVMRHRRRIGIVTQDPILFSGTIRSNIVYGSSSSSSSSSSNNNRRDHPQGNSDNRMKDVIAAAKLANAHGFIENFPDGYDTQTGERGVQLSGGQKQRIAIARAIMKKPELLLLDEATSALDSESEKLVQDALDQLISGNKDITTIVIAHRLQTVRNADCIVVIDGGRVHERGSHLELMKKDDGLYRKMVRRAEESGILPED